MVETHFENLRPVQAAADGQHDPFGDIRAEMSSPPLKGSDLSKGKIQLASDMTPMQAAADRRLREILPLIDTTQMTNLHPSIVPNVLELMKTRLGIT